MQLRRNGAAKRRRAVLAALEAAVGSKRKALRLLENPALVHLKKFYESA